MVDIPVARALWSDLIRQIARRTRNRTDAEDLLHSAYLRLARYGSQHPVGDPAAFLVRTAFNISIDNYRHEKVLQNQTEASDVEDAAPQVADNDVPAITYLDLRGSYKWTDNIQLYLAIDNATNLPPPIIPVSEAGGQLTYFFAPIREDVYDAIGPFYRLGIRLSF